MTDDLFIISESQLQKWIEGCYRAKDIYAEAHSQPYPVPSQTRFPPKECPCTKYATCKECIEAHSLIRYGWRQYQINVCAAGR